MWRAVVTTVAPQAEPLTPEQMRSHLRIEHTDDDGDIAAAQAGARGLVEGSTGTRMVTQTVVLRTDCWADLVRLPVAPIASVTAIAYVDTDGAGQSLDVSVYEVRAWGLEPAIVLKFGQAWPPIQAGSLIEITAVAGYGAAGQQPADVLAAIKLLAADYYAFRESAQVGSVASMIPMGGPIDALLENHRLHLI